MGATLIPVPFVNGVVAGSMLFIGGHELAQHPDSGCMMGSFRPIVQSRTWKHISAGAFISGIGWGFGLLAAMSKIPVIVSLGVAFGLLGGPAFGFSVAYSDSVFVGQPRDALLVDNSQQPLIEEGSSRV